MINFLGIVVVFYFLFLFPVVSVVAPFMLSVVPDVTGVFKLAPWQIVV